MFDLRISTIDKKTAADFIEKHHSALPYLNTRGLIFTIGLYKGDRLVAVATANTPTGRFDLDKRVKSGELDIGNILELTRIASDGTIPNASSILASRMIDLLEVSLRGAKDKESLFVTYSLESEQGSTYRALSGKGLRPTRYSKGRKPSGSRREGGHKSLSEIDKLRWEAGSAADRTPIRLCLSMEDSKTFPYIPTKRNPMPRRRNFKDTYSHKLLPVLSGQRETSRKQAEDLYVYPKLKKFPIGDEFHARLALIYVMSPTLSKYRKKVIQAVKQAYPDIAWGRWWNSHKKDHPDLKNWGDYVNGMKSNPRRRRNSEHEYPLTLQGYSVTNGLTLVPWEIAGYYRKMDRTQTSRHFGLDYSDFAPHGEKEYSLYAGRGKRGVQIDVSPWGHYTVIPAQFVKGKGSVPFRSVEVRGGKIDPDSIQMALDTSSSRLWHTAIGSEIVRTYKSKKGMEKRVKKILGGNPTDFPFLNPRKRTNAKRIERSPDEHFWMPKPHPTHRRKRYGKGGKNWKPMLPTFDSDNVVGAAWHGTYSSPKHVFFYALPKWERDIYSYVKLKKGEKLLRYTSPGIHAATPDVRPLVKVNVERDLLYFMTPQGMEEDRAIFEKRGTKLRDFALYTTADFSVYNNPRKRKGKWTMDDEYKLQSAERTYRYLSQQSGYLSGQERKEKEMALKVIYRLRAKKEKVK